MSVAIRYKYTADTGGIRLAVQPAHGLPEQQRHRMQRDRGRAVHVCKRVKRQHLDAVYFFLHRLSQHPVHAVMLNVDLVQTYVARLVQLAAPGNSVHMMELLHDIYDKLTIQEHQMPPCPYSATRISF